MDSSDIIRFLVASDVHAGYGETKGHIHNDSFESFEEVLKIGLERNVDFVLLGGDLFHENNPSRETQLKVTRLLRQYSYRNGRPVGVEFMSDPRINFHHSNFPTVNYKDENLHVGMPIFTIHGNHDDLSGKGLTALDIFHENGLINLFGKFNDVDHIEVAPILLRKGRTKIAIYGISSQRDDRLSRAFSNGSVKFLRPDEEPDSWFSILVVHQNRPRRSTSRTTGAFLPIIHIPVFFDIIIWGHEHECLIEPQYFTVGENESGDTGFFIIQPGSTVATSLCREEAVPKHCAIISVKERKFKSKAFPIECTRQLLLDELHLHDAVSLCKVPRSTVRQKNMPDEEIIAQRIEEILQEAEKTRGPRQPILPLVRLKVIYSGLWTNFPPINGRRFGARYSNRVANASEMISVKVIRPEKPRDTGDSLNVVLGKKMDELHSVDQMVEKYFGECNFDDKMSVLTELAMSRSIKEYSNVDATFTAADRSLTESIKNQINAFATRIQTASEMLQIDNADETALSTKVERIVMEMKRQQSGVIPTQSATSSSSYFGEPAATPVAIDMEAMSRAIMGEPSRNVKTEPIALHGNDDATPLGRQPSQTRKKITDAKKQTGIFKAPSSTLVTANVFENDDDDFSVSFDRVQQNKTPNMTNKVARVAQTKGISEEDVVMLDDDF